MMVTKRKLEDLNVMDDFIRETDADLNMTKYRIAAEMNIDRYRGCTLTFKVGAAKEGDNNGPR